MVGSITARTLDYFGVLVAASVVDLCSAGVASLCVKFEERGLGRFLGSILVLHWPPRAAWGSCCDERNL